MNKNLLGEMEWKEHNKQSTKLSWEEEPCTHTALKADWRRAWKSSHLVRRGSQRNSQVSIGHVGNIIEGQDKFCPFNSPKVKQGKRQDLAIVSPQGSFTNAQSPSSTQACPSLCQPDTLFSWEEKMILICIFTTDKVHGSLFLPFALHNMTK